MCFEGMDQFGFVEYWQFQIAQMLNVRSDFGVLLLPVAFDLPLKNSSSLIQVILMESRLENDSNSIVVTVERQFQNLEIALKIESSF